MTTYQEPQVSGEEIDAAFSDAYRKLWNEDEQRRIDADIEKNRKADAVVNLGEAAWGGDVKVEQLKHDFIFGAHIFNFDQLGDDALNAKYKSLFGTLFNSATVAFYWCKFEMERGRPRFAGEYWDSQEYWANCSDPKSHIHWRRPPTDPVINYLKDRGVRVHGHTILWGNKTYNIPLWLYDKCLEGDEREKFAKIIKGTPMLKHGTLREFFSIFLPKRFTALPGVIPVVVI